MGSSEKAFLALNHNQTKRMRDFQLWQAGRPLRILDPGHMANPFDCITDDPSPVKFAAVTIEMDMDNHGFA